jgi:hypothetical protein
LAADSGWTAGLTPDEGDVFAVGQRVFEELDAVSPMIARVSAIAFSDGVSQWQNLAITSCGTRLEAYIACSTGVRGTCIGTPTVAA